MASAGLSSVISSAAAGWLIEIVGPCRLIQLLLLPVAISWIVMATSNSFGWVMAGRVITGSYVQLVVITIQVGPFKSTRVSRVNESYSFLLT